MTRKKHMTLLRSIFVTVTAVCLVAPGVANAGAEVTISDWRGASVTATEGSVDSNGVTIAYHTVGEGPLVIFVHSIFGPWFDFRHQIVSLSEHYRVVSMSTRGTDGSDKPVGDEHYSSAKIAEDINAIIDHFGEERATLVGQDSGGLHAWHFAMAHPERTERLISLGSIHPAGLIRELVDNPEQQAASTFQRGMQENPEAGAQLEGFVQNFQPIPGEPAELAQLRKDAYQRLDVRSIVSFYRANWPRSPVTLETEGFGFTYGSFPPVQAPTLFIYGKASGPFKNPTLNDMWEWVEGDLTIQVLEGVGHDPHSAVPELVTPLMVEWLQRAPRMR